jgi:hypothetical protein
MTQVFCSPMYFIVKEVARRSQLTPYPVIVDEDDKLYLDGFNETGNAFMKAIYEKV